MKRLGPLDYGEESHRKFMGPNPLSSSPEENGYLFETRSDNAVEGEDGLRF